MIDTSTAINPHAAQPRSLVALAKSLWSNRQIIVVTNQAGIGRGYCSEQDFLTLTEWMRERFEAEGAPVTDVFYCPYHPEHGVGRYKKDSLYRKPNPGMLLRAAKKHGLDIGNSIMIGDKDSDMQAASKAGVGATWRVMTERSYPTLRRTRFTRCATEFRC
jgi:D-glycero-D-manno-heptose 1,7-bisphosphate phosphatase